MGSESGPPVTCWVIDHPAHAQALLPFIREGPTCDLIILTERAEIKHLVESSEGIMPRREQAWVKRAIVTQRSGFWRWWNSFRLAQRRMRTVRERLVKRVGTEREVTRIVAIGASLELRAAKKVGIGHRIYISDVEVNHLAHRLALGSATDILVPQSWRENLDGGLLKKAVSKGIKIHHFPGNKAHLYLRPMIGQKEQNGSTHLPRVFVRSIKGGGVHDSGEPTPMPETPEGWQVEQNEEGQCVEEPWELPNRLLSYDGVITQSVSLAMEALTLGVPTLLCSRAERGVLDKIEEQGGPLVRWPGEEAMEKWSALVVGDSNNVDWPDAKRAWDKALTTGTVSAL